MYPIVSHYWICQNCSMEKEGTHGDVFMPPKHCDKPIISHHMDNQRIIQWNVKILRNHREFLNKEDIATLASQAFGLSVSHYKSLSKTKLNQEIDRAIKNIDILRTITKHASRN